MKNPVFLLILLFISIQSRSQVGDYYYGVNGKLLEMEDEACFIKCVGKAIGARYEIVTIVRVNDNEWEFLNSEEVWMKSEDLHVIMSNGESLIQGKSERRIKNLGNGIYLVKDYKKDKLVRTAHCSQLLPLHFEGMVTEYYENGNKKSESMYMENMLQSNKNWNPDGKAYIDNIFFSTHTSPTYPYGNEGIQKFISERFAEGNLSTHGISGDLILGAVVMETGTLDGIKIIQGIRPDINAFFMEVVKALPGKWGPATLEGEKVRYFIQIPLRIENDAVTLLKFEISRDGRMILMNE